MIQDTLYLQILFKRVFLLIFSICINGQKANSISTPLFIFPLFLLVITKTTQQLGFVGINMTRCLIFLLSCRKSDHYRGRLRDSGTSPRPFAVEERNSGRRGNQDGLHRHLRHRHGKGFSAFGRAVSGDPRDRMEQLRQDEQGIFRKSSGGGRQEYGEVSRERRRPAALYLNVNVPRK